MPRPPLLLRENVPFRRFWAGQTVSLFGDQISLLAIPLLAVLTLHADAAQMGLLGAAELVPYLLFAIHVGAWAGTRRGRSLLIVADLGRAALLLSIPLAAALGNLSMGLLYAVAFGVGTLAVVFDVAYQTVFAELVEPEDYVVANSFLVGSRSVSIVGGKSAGGLLVAALTAPVAIFADALSYLGSALFVSRTPPREPAAAAAEPGGIGAGIRFIARTRLLRTTLAAVATLNVFNSAFWAMLVLFATDELGLGAGAIGLALGIGALGSVLGSALAAPLSRRFGLGKAVVASFVLGPAPLVLVAFAPSSPLPGAVLLAIAEFLSGIGIMLLDISLGAVQTALIPDRLRARVAGAYIFVNWGVRPLGALAGGLLAGAIGLRPTMWIASAGAIAAVLWLLPSGIARVRRVSAHTGLTFSS
ncbi:MAG TPA: MFS transporter [Solirubrobacterales bacterium]|nr:MFS transporter [Solirubrobacterales bacterium]